MTLRPDGRARMSGTGSHVVEFYDALAGKELRRVKGPEGNVNALAFSPDAKCLASGGGDGVRLWDVDGQRELRRFELRSEPSVWVTGLAFFPDGKRILAGTGNSFLHLWDFAGSSKPRLIPTNTSSHMTLPPNGKVVVTWEAGGGLSPPGALAVLDPYSWKPVHQWRLHKGDRGNQFILATSLSPNGKTLNASVGGDGQHAI